MRKCIFVLLALGTVLAICRMVAPKIFSFGEHTVGGMPFAVIEVTADTSRPGVLNGEIVIVAPGDKKGDGRLAISGHVPPLVSANPAHLFEPGCVELKPCDFGPINQVETVSGLEGVTISFRHEAEKWIVDIAGVPKVTGGNIQLKATCGKKSQIITIKYYPGVKP